MCLWRGLRPHSARPHGLAVRPSPPPRARSSLRGAWWSVPQVNDVSTVIPRNSVIEANQSGLIAEPLLDVTPQIPLPQWRAGPHETGCADEGAIVCVNGR